MRKGICLLLIICCNITFIGCRKAADRGRSAHVRTETSKKNNKQVCVRNKKTAESVKKSDTPLSVSNYHVFEGTTIGKENIKLANNNKTLYKLKDIVYKSKEQDFIIFHIDYNNSIYMPIADTKPKIGEKVYAIGSPRGLENTFSSGEISQWRAENLMQISALIDHGSSGGALINEYGEVVGITSGSFADGSQANLNYAWSIEVIKPYL